MRCHGGLRRCRYEAAVWKSPAHDAAENRPTAHYVNLAFTLSGDPWPAQPGGGRVGGGGGGGGWVGGGGVGARAAGRAGRDSRCTYSCRAVSIVEIRYST